MAKIKDILEIEVQRSTLEQCRQINLFQEGTFYRAYEWSAWLCVRYVQEFKTTKRKFKNDDTTMVFVGFPVTSMSKYTPDGAEMNVGEDKSVQIELPEGVFNGITDVQQLHNDFENWKNSVPLVESSKKDIEMDNVLGNIQHPVRLTDIMHKILAYPIEQKSPMECMSFLAEIKKRIAEII